MREKIEKELIEIKKSLKLGIDVDIELIDITKDNSVKVKLTSHSPMSIVTLIETGIGKTLKKKVPEVKEVIFV
jgi:Fe-S cluster biogenesis protein NfuA